MLESLGNVSTSFDHVGARVMVADACDFYISWSFEYFARVVSVFEYEYEFEQACMNAFDDSYLQRESCSPHEHGVFFILFLFLPVR